MQYPYFCFVLLFSNFVEHNHRIGTFSTFIYHVRIVRASDFLTFEKALNFKMADFMTSFDAIGTHFVVIMYT